MFINSSDIDVLELYEELKLLSKTVAPESGLQDI